MELTIDDKKNTIYNLISSIQNTGKIIQFINNRKINYTQNQNGIYVNITVLSDELINELYDLMHSIIDDDVNEKKNTYENQTTIKTEIKTKEKKYYKLKLTKLQKELLNHI